MNNELSSNIINSEDLCKRFYNEALKVTNSLKYRYFSVFEQMTAEDVVMECFVKILKSNISYDDSKGCKFETFVRMIVTCQLTDELKWLSASKRSGVVVSLDSEVAEDKDGDCGSSNNLYSTIGDSRSQYCFEYSEVKRDLKEVEEDFLMSKDSILDMGEEGYTLSDMALISDSDRIKIRNRLREIRKVYLNRCEGIAMEIADILYGDDEIREKKEKDLISVTSLIVDEKTGVKLSDVVRLVLKDYSYNKIGERLNMSSKDVRMFLSKYESMRI